MKVFAAVERRIRSSRESGNGTYPSLIQQERLPALKEIRRLSIPFLQQQEQPAALDGEPHLVRAREAIDDAAPGEVARMLPADLVDEQERCTDRSVGLLVGDDEADRRDRLPLNLPAVCATDIVMASNRIPGSRIAFMTLTTSGALSQEAPICSNGRSVPLPSVRLVPSK